LVLPDYQDGELLSEHAPHFTSTISMICALSRISNRGEASNLAGGILLPVIRNDDNTI